MEPNGDNKQTEKRKEPPKQGPSAYSITFGGLIAVAGLAASGVATYNSLQNDIATLKRGESYQEQTNTRLSDEMKAARQEQRETMREFNDKLDRIIEQWPRRNR